MIKETVITQLIPWSKMAIPMFTMKIEFDIYYNQGSRFQEKVTE